MTGRGHSGTPVKRLPSQTLAAVAPATATPLPTNQANASARTRLIRGILSRSGSRFCKKGVNTQE